ncbi:MAG: hypothetical protein ACLR0U_06860 [Enterocloster clostridioformis]
MKRKMKLIQSVDFKLLIFYCSPRNEGSTMEENSMPKIIFTSRHLRDALPEQL